MNIIWSIFNLLILLSVFLIVPILIGVYVYRDANRRGMNALVWTLIALFAPSLIGFIIYLLVRSGYSDLECPRCQTAIKEEYVLCPKCGAKLRPFCPNCSAPVEPDWKVCPRCAASLEEIAQDVVVPTRKKDKSLGVILLLVILIPVILIIAFVGLFAFQMAGTTGPTGGTSIYAVNPEAYIAEMQSEEIAAWYQNCNDNRAHVLTYGNESEDCVYYLIYLPGLRDTREIDFDNNEGFFRNKLEIEYDLEGRSNGEHLILAACTGNDKAKKLLITCDDKKMDYVMESTITEIIIPADAEMVVAEHYSGDGRNGVISVRQEETPESRVGE
ncbi:MAG: zinc ribbon domain-containing protein [Oscillospiraceae bacterium]|nr:zinc ribbon domain-containing protein [Oscillospiraceae bacterium]